MKVYLLREEDFEKLLLKIAADPIHGHEAGGSSSQSSVRDPAKAAAYEEAYGFYNYNVRRWIAEVCHD